MKSGEEDEEEGGRGGRKKREEEEGGQKVKIEHRYLMASLIPLPVFKGLSFTLSCI